MKGEDGDEARGMHSFMSASKCTSALNLRLETIP